MRLFLLLGLVATAAVAEAPPSQPPPTTAPAAAPKTEPKADEAEIVVPAPAPEAAQLPQAPDAPKIDPSLPGGTTAKSEEPQEDLDFGWMLLRTVAVLGVVIMLAWFSLNYGLRKLMGLKPVVGGASVVQVLERVPLDNKHSMFVIQAAGEYLLIGGGEGNLQLISKLSKEDVEKLRSESKSSPTLMQSPLLQRLLTRREPTPPAKTGSNG
ncbi:MAG: flagellar biosynthetic protein FliO [Myxococcaceae bacterium]